MSAARQGTSGGALVVDNIGLLVTNDAEGGGEGSLGLLRNASVVVDADGHILSVGPAGQSADRRIDAGGRCVLPGFVDSHTHLVFAGDRSEEFSARMAGQPYAAGGIRTTVAATRAATDADLRQAARARVAEARRSGITTIEAKSGYGLTTEHELRCLHVAESFADEVTLLGAHVVPQEFDDRADAYVAHVCDEMIPAVAAARVAGWVDAFCEIGAFDVDQCRTVLAAASAHQFGTRLHANQLGHGPGVQLAVEMGCASADHCTYLDDDDIAALAASDTVATFLPATDFSTRQPYPDARRAIDAGCRVALATNCNPGSSYTTSMSFCIALAVRDMRMTIDEAIAAATVGGARALRREDIGRLSVGSRGDLVILDAPSYTHLVYRPGMPLIDTVIRGGSIVVAGGAHVPSPGAP